MQIFLVGGAVRDKLLNYPHSERDWVVVGSSQAEMLDHGYKQVGNDFPVFLHPKTQEEYALARTERKSGSGYTGFEFSTDKTITLEEDLSRRDLTINAIAETIGGDIIDPFNGKADLENKILRHVTSSFAEDPVRILRVARFHARYHHLGFTVADETMALMNQMVVNGEASHLVAERVWKEFEKALSERDPQCFIETLRQCGALSVVAPEVDALFGIPQPKQHHPEIDTGIHTLLCLKRAAELTDDKCVRFATLMHDLGKALTPEDKLPQHIAHEVTGLKPIKHFCKRISAPNEYRDLALIAAQYHTHCHRALELKPQTILKLFESIDAYRKPFRFSQFLICCQADAQGRTGFHDRPYPQRQFLEKMFTLTNAVSAKPYIEQGVTGKEVGEKIRTERISKIKEFKEHYLRVNKQ